jgi:CAP12/Pycsar effector protein, TIR domain
MSITNMADLLQNNRIFVGSSTEGKAVAEKVVDSLTMVGLSPLPWYDFFKSNRSPLQELEHLTLQSQGAVLVASPDDRAIIRDEEWNQMRDNVLFEYGLFAGVIGRSKCALLVPDAEEFRIPSDLLGVACFERYTTDTLDRLARLVAENMKLTVSHPVPVAAFKSQARRALRLIGWLRDEAFRVSTEWARADVREICIPRIRGVSAFIRQDIETLSLQDEYGALESAILSAIDSFPTVNLRHALDGVLASPPSEEALKAISRWGEITPCLGDFPESASRSTPLKWLRKRPKAPHECHLCESARERWRKSSGSYYVRQRCGSVLWAVGVAQSATLFQAIAGNFRNWRNERIPAISDAIATLEVRLHENIFGAF